MKRKIVFYLRLLLIFGVLSSLNICELRAQWEDDGWWDSVWGDEGLYDFGDYWGRDLDGDGDIDQISYVNSNGDVVVIGLIDPVEDSEIVFDPIDEDDPYVDPNDDPNNDPYDDPNNDPNNNSEPKDCAGVEGGSAYLDACGECVGGTTGKEPCATYDPCALAALAADVYLTQNGGLGAFTFGSGWQIDTEFDLYNNQIILRDNQSGFNSAIYKRMTSSGNFEYMYVTQGTDMDSSDDWKNNYQQGVGKPSKQYELSINNAENLAKWAKKEDVSLFFSGHSLGGGLASANALKTGYPAITFNAAALHPNTKELYGLTQNAVIEAYIVKGELLDQLNMSMGMRAEGNINEIEVSLQWLRNALPGLAGLTDAAIRHTMASVIKALNCDE